MNQEHYDKLKEGVDAWNAWRKENPMVIPDLRKANLNAAVLDGADLRKAKLRKANLWGATLKGTNLRGASLHKADLDSTSLCWDKGTSKLTGDCPLTSYQCFITAL